MTFKKGQPIKEALRVGIDARAQAIKEMLEAEFNKVENFYWRLPDIGNAVKMENGIGEVTVVHEDSRYDDGSEAFLSIIHFKDHDLHMCLEGWYSSTQYGGNGREFEGWDIALRPAVPQVVTKTIYTDKNGNEYKA